MENAGDNDSSHTEDAQGVSHEHKAGSGLEDEALGNGENASRDEGQKPTGEGESEDVREPEVGMVFKSYEEVNSYYKRYAYHAGFSATVLKSSFTEFGGLCRYLVLACSRGRRGRLNANYKTRASANKTDCSAMIVLKLWGDGLLHLVESKLEHNHAVNPAAAIPFKRTPKMAEGSAGNDNSQCSVLGSRSWPESTVLKLEGVDRDSVLQFFGRMKAKNSNFFYTLDLDKKGYLRNLFWADARSRSAYRYFSDVISLDTTCLNEKYDLPLVLFVGMSHHGQLVLLGCALLSSQTTEAYSWLLKTWLTCMLQRQPSAIITDHGKEIQDAVAKVFPGVKHRLCLSHILKKLPDKLKEYSESEAIKDAVNRAIFCTSGADEFEGKWKKMTADFKLEGDEWLTSLYEDRKHWVPMFLKDTFWAGLSISQYGESTNAYFDGCVSPRTSLEQFLSKYEAFLESKFRKEIQEDSNSFHKTQLISKFFMEEQILKLYTGTMFRKFQDELRATINCHTSLVKVDGPVSTFKVKEHFYKEDAKLTESRDYEVTFNPNKLVVLCVCGSFHFKGILCRHILSVFKVQQVFEIPSDYVLDRWRRDFKWLHSLSHSSPDGLPNKLTARYDSLCMRLLQLVELGMASDERYQLALKMTEDAERFLHDGFSSIDDIQAKLIPSSENETNAGFLQLTMAQVLEANKKAKIASGKRRGRPPKHPREPNPDTNKEREFLISSLIENENNAALQISSTSTHVNPHPPHPEIHGGIDLMEDINPTDLSFGSHYGIHVDPHQHVTNQARPQPVNLEQGHYDQQQPAGNQSGMQWIFHHMLQDDQLPKTPADWRIG